ncbi:MAG TPA: M20/M25/M40 family metallo-hydrolase [Longimicrobiales bacterium]
MTAVVRSVFALLLATSVLTSTAAAQDPVNAAMVARIRDEGLNRSQVMDHISWLSDVYGPRLQGSPAMQQAADWAGGRMKEWGLANIHQEHFPFGRGWSLVRFSAHMIAPQVQPIIGMPESWTPGTNGTVTADVVLAPIATAADFDAWRGKLRGKIVLTQPARAVRMLEGRIVLRMNEDDIAEATAPVAPAAPGGAGARAGAPASGARGGAPAVGARGGAPGAGARAGAPAGNAAARPSATEVAAFYKAEGVVALLERTSGGDASGGSNLSWMTQPTDGGTFTVGSGGSRVPGAEPGLPSIVLAVEHYNRMVRILEKNIPVRMELNVETKFYDETTPLGFNLIAEIPGTDPRLRDEIVMLGAHLDSHHGATGATDNATGSAAMMEALRILKAVDAKPRRTIRIALWGAEEQGLLGSRAYVREHFKAGDTIKAGHAKLSAYYNLDNGTGRIRGIWLQQNDAARPIFESFMKPLADLGVELIGPRSVGSTDHSSFESAGLPGFQFMQERLEYNSRTHHTNMDFYDRVQAEDMVQMATVAAVFAYLTAQRDELMPRKASPASR